MHATHTIMMRVLSFRGKRRCGFTVDILSMRKMAHGIVITKLRSSLIISQKQYSTETCVIPHQQKRARRLTEKMRPIKKRLLCHAVLNLQCHAAFENRYVPGAVYFGFRVCFAGGDFEHKSIEVVGWFRHSAALGQRAGIKIDPARFFFR
jgi:hypothetical protein